MDWKNVLERAAWTFVETFVAVLVVADLSTGKEAIVAAAGAALSVIKTVAQERLQALR